MKTEQKTAFVLTQEEIRAFDEVSDIIMQICNKQKKSGEDEERLCTDCPCFYVCDKDCLFDSMREFFDCNIESE